MKSLVVGLCVVLSGLLFSGCVSEGGGEAAPSDEQAPEAQPTADAGTIQGTVLDEEGLPLAGATVSILELGLVGTSDSDGVYTINQIPPGTYQLISQRLGYESRGQLVEVVANEVTVVDIVLEVLPTAEPRIDTVRWNGFMACSIAAPIGYSEECGEGVGTPVGTFGTNPNNLIDYDWDVPERPKTILTETVWEPASQFASAMFVIFVKDLVCDPICDSAEQYGTAESAPPVRIIADEGDFPKDEASYPLFVTLRHWAATSPDAGPTGDTVVIIIDQPFEVYKTEFFGQPIPNDDWTALPPAGP